MNSFREDVAGFLSMTNIDVTAKDAPGFSPSVFVTCPFELASVVEVIQLLSVSIASFAMAVIKVNEIRYSWFVKGVISMQYQKENERSTHHQQPCYSHDKHDHTKPHSNYPSPSYHQ